jgi:uncharacterized protein YcaQ
VTLDDPRRSAIACSLCAPTTLQRALNALGFVQADPIRAPARAQDLVLRHRVTDYRAGDLERRYSSLDVHEDFFVNYGFVTGTVQALMHPRGGPTPWTAPQGRHVRALLDFVRARGRVHPREVDKHFSRGTVTNYWGGSSSATTHLLDAMHYRGLLRVVHREAGIRIYAVHKHEARPRDAATRNARLDALVDVAVRKYAPLPAVSLSSLVKRLRFAVPQWAMELERTLERARHRLASARIAGVDWYWPAEQPPAITAPNDLVYLLAPFDPVVWDRRRFEILWDWSYRLEAYTPLSKRKLGYYALPLLWRDRVVGWANVSVKNGKLRSDFGYVGSGPPQGRVFRRALEQELDRLQVFLGLQPDGRAKVAADQAQRFDRRASIA